MKIKNRSATHIYVAIGGEGGEPVFVEATDRRREVRRGACLCVEEAKM